MPRWRRFELFVILLLVLGEIGCIGLLFALPYLIRP